MKKLFWLSVLALLAVFDRVVPEFIEDIFHRTPSTQTKTTERDR